MLLVVDPRSLIGLLPSGTTPDDDVKSSMHDAIGLDQRGCPSMHDVVGVSGGGPFYTFKMCNV